jgi:ferredoxin
MPNVEFAGASISVETGENLRSALMRAGLPLYNGAACLIHCRGIGTCGTCAVAVTSIDPSKSVDDCLSSPTRIEKARLAFPPHASGSDLRLACQCKVLDDIQVHKHAGLWGHRVASPS